MGLDIYAGTLTRYYAHNWKTAVQQWAEANGYDCTIMRPAAAEAEEEEKLSADEIREVVETWRDDLLGALSQYSEEPYEPWPEDEEKPYFTDKPDWDAYNTLRLYAFHALLDKPLPEKFPRRGACEDFISMSEEEKEKAEGLSLCGGAEWWLPLKEQFTFSADTPAGNEAAFGTAGMLAAELKYINDKVWQAGEEEILKWNGTEGYKAEALFTEKGEFAPVPKNEREGEDYDAEELESLAKFAFSIFYQAAKFSLENRVPVLMDY